MTNPFHKPVRITQGYGPTSFTAEPAWGGYKHFHRGIDAVPADGEGTGAKLYSVAPGAVYAAGTDGVDGARYVIVRHDDGTYGCYWHLNTITVKNGARVDETTQIGTMGSTGNSTGPHLHFELVAAGGWRGLLQMTPLDSTSIFMTTTTPATGPEQEQVTTKEHIIFEVQDIADVIGGDPHYDETQKDAFNAHVERVLTKGGLEGRALMRDFLKDYGWQDAVQVKAIADDRDRKAEALKGKEGVEAALNETSGRLLMTQDQLRQAREALQNAPTSPGGTLNVGDAFTALLDAIVRRVKGVK